MISRLDTALLCNFDEEFDTTDFPDNVKLLLKGNWVSVIDDSVLESVLTYNAKSVSLSENLKTKSEDNLNKFLVIAIACVNAFCESNWVGSNDELEQVLKSKLPAETNASKELTLDGEEIYSTIIHPELLMIALKIFNALPDVNLVCVWWKMRCYYLYQKILEERSITIFEIMENLLNKLKDFEIELESNSKLKALLNLEKNQIHLAYGRIQNSEQCLDIAKNTIGLNLELKGALGKRTKFQGEAVAQLNLDVTYLKPEIRLPAYKTHPNSYLIAPLKLDDDLRLENIEFLDIKENSSVDLTSIEQLICLNMIQYLQRSQPKDDLADEELFPYLNVLITQNYGTWVGRICSLLTKCKLESHHKRTVERAMMQCEEIVNSLNKTQPNSTTRLSYVWASGLPLVIHMRSQLADLLLSIGLVKAALDIYLHLHLWEEVIACYTILELRHKAAEIIQQQINIKPTTKLYCLLGDATDNIELYEKAWDFSQKKSSKAQRHWGNYLFSHKKYQECIPHYQKSCEINSLQDSVWFRLGYAALVSENWELAATAYRRYTFLEPNSFEAWNNLAKVYVKQGNKERAYKALSEALKFNYDNWQVWENMMIVSLDTGHFDDVIRSYHRLLDLRNKHLDIEVLTFLVKAILQNAVDADGNSAERIISNALKLFGRISTIHPNDASLWQLYADISPTALLKGQKLIKSYSSLTNLSNWASDPQMCERICDLVEDIANISLEAKNIDSDTNKSQITELFSSARLTIQAVIRVVSKENYSQFEDKIVRLQKLLDDITVDLKKRLS